MSKFKIGDTIHYMASNKAEAKEIKGISTIQGTVEVSAFKKTVPEGVIAISYHTGFYETIEEENAYATREELQQSVFKD